MRKSWVVSASVAMAIAAASGVCSPAAPREATRSARDNGDLIASTAPGAQRFRAVGKLAAYKSCSATVIAGTDAPSPQTHALVLAAGHCAGKFGANDVTVDAPAPDGWTFTPDYFYDNQANHHPLVVERTLYATMKGVDIAVFRLRETYGDLARLGITPLHFSVVPVTPGTVVELAHIPVNGIATEERFMRHSVCETGAHHVVYEDLAPWLWNDAVASNCAKVAGGSSGAPLVRNGASEVVGVMNTVVDAELNGCGENRPCELAQPVGYSRSGATYFIPVSNLARAIRPDSTLDVSQLDNGRGVVLKRERPSWMTQSRIADEQGTLRPVNWAMRVEAGTLSIRYKSGLADQVNCADSSGYGPATDAATQPLIGLPVGSAQGIYKLCVVGKASDEAAWQPDAFATVVLHEIDETPPTELPAIVMDKENDVAWYVYAQKRPSEIVGLRVKHGPAASTDCHVMDGYFLPIKMWETLYKAERPQRFCAIGLDAAGNMSPLVQRDFP
ncbi:hypothetical protein FHW69_000619 [Luteibacter sp. Sphag1AF]|uniref:trypsin n=1 Tax=Luteibacter sp. Sphag1AF TaxID=2587031 RepID=UPI0016223505|nr:trypsin [Luteibacter sp. Sphag1AF]MBB3226029.1 hypothetical protein [Luteibacter sp. Sphag1AF]